MNSSEDERNKLIWYLEKQMERYSDEIEREQQKNPTKMCKSCLKFNPLHEYRVGRKRDHEVDRCRTCRKKRKKTPRSRRGNRHKM